MLKVFGGNIIIHGSVIGKNVFIAVDETITTFGDQLKVTIVGSIHETTNIYSVGPVEVKSKKMIVLHPDDSIRGASHKTLELLMRDKNLYENIYLFRESLFKFESFYAGRDSSLVIDAIEGGHLGYLKILIAVGPNNLNFKKQNGETALSIALREGNQIAVTWLVDCIQKGFCSIPLSRRLLGDAAAGGCEAFFSQQLAAKNLRLIRGEEASDSNYFYATIVNGFLNFSKTSSVHSSDRTGRKRARIGGGY